jgi:putative ABC transport system substrate-binding protein
MRNIFLSALVLFTAVVAAFGQAQTPEVARIGFLWPSQHVELAAELWERLRALGWEEGRNLVVERRTSEGRMERVPQLMSQLVAQHVDVLVTVSTPAAMAAKRATSSIPVVAGMMGDPVGAGLANSLARPGGNLTGLSYGFSEGFPAKWVELLRECVPGLKGVAILYNAQNAWAVHELEALEAGISSLSLKPHRVEISGSAPLSEALANARRHVQGAVVIVDPLTYQVRDEIGALAMRHRLPVVTSMPEFTDLGVLLSYGVDNGAVLRRMADYVDKILRGAKPAELPIEQPTQVMLVVNAKTAASLGLTIPASVLERADRIVK